MINIIWIGIIIILIVIINDKNKELNKLKKENNLLHINIKNMATILNEKNKSKQEIIPDIKQQQEEVLETKTIPKEKDRNNLILITGSILIVLAAILFLTSTWNVLPNIIKVITVFFLVFIFLGLSYYAKHNLNILKTAKAFFYIAMIYIPISLISIAPLGLLGKTLQSGKYLFLYLAITSIITSIIYFFSSKKEEKLSYANYLFQLLSVLFFLIFLDVNYQVYFLGFTIYNIAILIKNIYFETAISKQIENILHITLTILLTLLSSLLIIIGITEPSENIPIIDLTIPYFITMFLQLIISIYYGRKENYHHALVPVYAILLIGTLTLKLDLSLFIQQIIMLVTLTLLYIRLELDLKNTTSLDWIVIIISFASLFIANMLSNYLWLAITLITVTIFINIYRYLKEKWTVHITLSIWLIAFLFYLVTYTLNLSFQEFVLSLTIIEIVKCILMKKVNKEKLKDIIELNTNIILIPCLIIFAIDNILDGGSKNFLIPLIITITTFLNYHNSKKSYHLLITYFAFSIFLEAIVNIIPIEIPKYLSFTITSLLLITIKLLSKKKLIEFKNYLSIYVFALLSVTFLDKGINYILIIITILLTLFYNKKIEHNKILENTSYVFLTILLFTEKVVLYDIELNPLLSLIMIIIWMKDSYLAKQRLTTDFISPAYIILNHIMYPLNTYYTIILLIIWSFTNMDKNKKYPNIIRVCFYLTCLWLYETIFSNFNRPTVFTILGYLLTLFLITQTIIKKKEKESANILEYLGTIILFAIAIAQYKNQLDGIIFVTFLLLTTILSYYKKISSLFYLSIIFILINIFSLTIEFWTSLPWWLYILVVGIILIIFATNNELQKSVKKQKILEKLNNYFKE